MIYRDTMGNEARINVTPLINSLRTDCLVRLFTHYSGYSRSLLQIHREIPGVLPHLLLDTTPEPEHPHRKHTQYIINLHPNHLSSPLGMPSYRPILHIKSSTKGSSVSVLDCTIRKKVANQVFYNNQRLSVVFIVTWAQSGHAPMADPPPQI
jgi:hypothetical protein